MGRKASHWMWFVFPQVEGLGFSEMSRRFAISSLAEAQAYMAHPVLGPRLVRCATIVAATGDKTAEDIFGSVDAQKLRSCMTLFGRAAPDEPVFKRVLDRYFGGGHRPGHRRAPLGPAGHALRLAPTTLVHWVGQCLTGAMSSEPGSNGGRHRPRWATAADLAEGRRLLALRP
jgi:uncharacterized protein (DUF1810 family)